METTLVYYLGQGYIISPLPGLVWLLAAVCLALNLERPSRRGL